MPVRLAISVEGPTEEGFVKEVLAPYLCEHNKNLCEVTPILIGKPGKRKHKGGDVSIDRIKKTLPKLQNFHYITTLYDFYGFKDKGQKTKQDLENDIKNSIPDKMRSKIIPYIQMYEFEGLLFSDPKFIATVLKDSGLEQWAKNILADPKVQNNPEQINDSQQTAPSKRLQKKYPGYKKTTYGPSIAKAIGISAMKSKCPNFKQWVETLETLS